MPKFRKTRIKTDEKLAQSKKQLRLLFADSPISLWEVDMSGIKVYLDRLRGKGIKDFRKYFEDRPEAVVRCAVLIKVVDVNKHTLELYKARGKEEFRNRFREMFTEETYNAFGEALNVIAKGQTRFKTETVTQTLRGNKINVIFRASVAPGHEKTFSRVLISTLDITKRKQAEEEMRRRSRELSVLYEIQRASTQSLDLKVRLSAALKATLRALEIDAGGIYLLEPDGETLTLRVHCGVPEGLLKTVEHMKLRKSLSGRAIVEERPVVLDVANHPDKRVVSPITKAGFKALMGIPLLAADKALGSLILGVRHSRIFPPAEIELLSVIGQQVGGAVHNAQLHQASRESMENFRALADSAMDGIVIISADGNFLYTNKRMAEITGYSVAALQRMGLKDIVPPERFKVAWRRHMARLKGRPLTGRAYEAHAIRKDGKKIPVEISAGQTLWEGEPADLAIIYDITERKRAEQALQESEEKYRVIVENSPNLVGILQDGVAKYVNKAACEKLGWTFEEMTSPSFNVIEKVITEESQALARENIAKRLRGEDIPPYEVRLKRRDDSEFPVMVLAGRILYHGKPADEIILVDITERKRAEQALRESEIRFRSLFADSPISLWEEDFSEVKKHLDGLRRRGVRNFRQYLEKHPELLVRYAAMAKIVDVNQVTLELYKARTKEELLAGLPKVFSKESYRVFKEEIIALAEGETEFESEAVNRSLKGDTINIILKWSVAPGYEETYSKVFVSIVDITERKRAEAELKQSFMELKKTLDGTVKALALAVEKRDPTTAGHERRVTKLACAIATEMGLSADRIEEIRVAGTLHDVGELYVPIEILSKPAQLTGYELDIIRTHPQVGYDILKEAELPCSVSKAVLQHQERLDGSGYPQGLSGEEITLGARIIAVADVVEAMCSHRPYRPLLGQKKALEQISQNKGTLYDPKVVDVCLRLFKKKGFKFD